MYLVILKRSDGLSKVRITDDPLVAQSVLKRFSRTVIPMDAWGTCGVRIIAKTPEAWDQHTNDLYYASILIDRHDGDLNKARREWAERDYCNAHDC